MAEEVSAIEKAAEKSTRVEMMKKPLSKVMKNAPKEVKKDLDKPYDNEDKGKHGSSENQADCLCPSSKESKKK